MKIVIPSYIKEQIQGLNAQQVKQKQDNIKESIDSIFTEKAVMMDYKAIFEYVVPKSKLLFFVFAEKRHVSRDAYMQHVYMLTTILLIDLIII